MILRKASIASSLHLQAFRTIPLFSFRTTTNGRDKINYSQICSRSVSSVVEVSEFECDVLNDDVKLTEKDNALRLALTQLAGDFTRESRLSLQRFFCSRHAPVISTGSLKLDLALGIGGLPRGRVVEIYGQEASGKTTLALHIIKEAQKLGGYCAYVDVENALDHSLAETMDINTEKLLISQPGSAENVMSMVNTLTKSGSLDVIVVDSVAALLPQIELDVPLGDTHKDMQSIIMSQALRKIHYSLSQSGTVLVFVNQTRFSAKSRHGYGNMEEVTCGGNALKFYAAVRLKIGRKGLLKTEDDKITGLRVCVQVTKNKLAPAMKKAELGIEFGRGFCSKSEVFQLACEHGIISEERSNYLIEGKVFKSKLAAEQYLALNYEIVDKIVMMLRRKLFEERL